VSTATVRVASAGLHVIDRWVDALVEALPADAEVGGSLTGGRIEVTGTDPATLAAALTAATTPGVTVLSVAWS
jgi:hypothetical protein